MGQWWNFTARTVQFRPCKNPDSPWTVRVFYNEPMVGVEPTTYSFAYTSTYLL